MTFSVGDLHIIPLIEREFREGGRKNFPRPAFSFQFGYMSLQEMVTEIFRVTVGENPFSESQTFLKT